MNLLLNDEIFRRDAESPKPASPLQKRSHNKVKAKIIKGHRSHVNYCQYMSEDQLILSCSDDRTTRIWNPHTGKCIETYIDTQSKAIRSAHVHPNNSEFVNCGDDRRVLFWDIEMNRVTVYVNQLFQWTGEHRGIILDCRISYDGIMLASCSDVDNKIKIWDRRGPKLFKNILDFDQKTSSSIRFTHTDDKLVSTSFDGTVSVFDLRTNRVTLKLKGHCNVVSCCSLNPNDHFLATGGWDKEIFIWDIASGTYRNTGPSNLTGHLGSVSCCVFNSKGNWLVTGGYDHLVMLWDVEKEMIVKQLSEHSRWVNDVDISSDNKTIISCSQMDTLCVQILPRLTLLSQNYLSHDRTIRVVEIQHFKSSQMVTFSDETFHQLRQCNQCGQTFLPHHDFGEENFQLCTYCKLKNYEKLNRYVSEEWD